MLSKFRPRKSTAMDNTSKGGLPRFWELFTVIPSAPKDFKRQQHCYLKTLGLQLKVRAF